MFTKKSFLVISSFTIMTVLAWIAFEINHSPKDAEIPSEIQTILEPINPNFDAKVLENIP